MGLRTSSTYEWDLVLFKKLGIDTFTTEEQEKIYLGEHKFEHYEKAKVKIWVTCLPAQIWEFEVTTDEDKVFSIETESGSLCDYWDSIEKIATDMLVVNAH